MTDSVRENDVFEPTDKEKGRYRDIERLTAGGMGVVYRAYDTILDKPVAIKTLIFDGFNEKLVPRFQLEAVVVSKLNHPNIVNILNFGVSNNTEPYMVMDFVVGRSLEEEVKARGVFPNSDIIEIAEQICRGMSHAHSRGIVHRDLKPSNILLTDGDTNNRVKIVDFGIAKLTDRDEDESALTQVGTLVGSPLYMSPEQVLGSIVDERSDIYSLGCVLYFMASGRPPFRGESAWDTMQDHVNTAPQIPVLAASEHTEDLSGTRLELSVLIMKCLEKDPDERYQSMDEVLDALEEASTVVEPETVVLPADRSVLRSNRLKKAFIGLGIVLLLAILVMVPPFISRNERAADKSMVASIESKNARTKEKAEKIIRDTMPVYGSSIGKFQVSNYYLNDSHEFYKSLKPFDGKQVGDEDINPLLEQRNRIRGLSIALSEVTESGLAKLTNLDLHSLSLDSVRLTDEAGKSIAKFKNLQYLNLNNTEFGDRGLSYLNNPKLSDLKLDFCKNVTDRGLGIIVKKWPDLNSLDVSETSTTATGMEKLAKLRSLKLLNANSCSIPDSLVGALRQSGLKEISIINGKISSANLEKLLEIPTLEKINAMGVVDDYPKWMVETTRKYRGRIHVDSIHDLQDKKVPDVKELPQFVDFLDSEGISP
ncbi:protein kinase [bacterium]|nr:protein kinase [bacterium]